MGKEATILESRTRPSGARKRERDGDGKESTVLSREPTATSKFGGMTAAETGALAGSVFTSTGITSVQESFAAGGGDGGGGTTTEGGAAPPPVQEDPWARLGDLLAGLQAPTIELPQPGEAQVSYAEGGINPFAILLILGAAGLGYWWYTKRRKGGGQS